MISYKRSKSCKMEATFAAYLAIYKKVKLARIIRAKH